MNNLGELFQRGLDAHLAGNLQSAGARYEQVLRSEPRHAEAWHLWGVVALQTGQHQMALERIGRAIALNPGNAQFHSNLGAVHESLGQLEQAAACFRRAAELAPGFVDAHANLGGALVRLGRPAEAVPALEAALRLRPDHPPTLNSLGVALRDAGRLHEAQARLRRAIELDPKLTDAQHNLGTVHQRLGDAALAQTCFETALRLRPDYAPAHHALGLMLKDQGRFQEAADHYWRALEIDRNSAVGYRNLGYVLIRLSQWSEAVAALRRSLELAPDHAETLSNLSTALDPLGEWATGADLCRRAIAIQPSLAVAHGNLARALCQLGQLDAAEASATRSIELQPTLADSTGHLASIHLLRGELEAGFAWYERRRGWMKFPPQAFPQPPWDGSDLAGRTILLHAEQGFGDTLQFVRYAAKVRERGGRVVVQCQAALARLLMTCPGVDEVVAQGTPLPSFDCHAPLMSLPHIFGTSLATIPAEGPYLQVDDAARAHWKNELKSVTGFRIGIVWQGHASHPGDRWRSIPLAQFAPLANLPGVRLVSLQVGGGDALERWTGPPIENLGDKFVDFQDTAAVVEQLDLVVACDTAVVHLAGALGKPVWAALPIAPDWRWMLEREDSPWYPTLRLFRQPQLGVWESVFARMAEELGRRLAG